MTKLPIFEVRLIIYTVLTLNLNETFPDHTFIDSHTNSIVILIDSNVYVFYKQGGSSQTYPKVWLPEKILTLFLKATTFHVKSIAITLPSQAGMASFFFF